MNFDQQIKQSPGYSGASKKRFIYESVATKLKQKKRFSFVVCLFCQIAGEFSNDLVNEL